MSTLSDQLAAEWFAVAPATVNVCSCCFRQYPIAGPDGPSVVCPHCGHTPDDAVCKSSLLSLAARRQEIADNWLWQFRANPAQEIGARTGADLGQTNTGFVYALLNPTMPGLVKIGMTEREPEERAKELSRGTGIPTPFVVAYAESFKDRFAAEGYVHSLMEQKGFRVSQNREFFCAPVKAAIQAIMKAKEREDLSERSPGTPANARSPE